MQIGDQLGRSSLCLSLASVPKGSRCSLIYQSAPGGVQLHEQQPLKER